MSYGTFIEGKKKVSRKMSYRSIPNRLCSYTWPRQLLQKPKVETRRPSSKRVVTIVKRKK